MDPGCHSVRSVLRGTVMLLTLMIPLGCVAQAASPPSGQASVIELPSFVNLVRQQGPAVVNISIRRTVRGQATMPPIPEGDPFFEFFRRFLPLPDPGEALSVGLGSGFIISQDGYILTNAHVVADADEVTVRLTDKREFKAKVLGADAYTDVALVKVEAAGLPVVRIGDASHLQAGEWVAAIGAPFGFENSVTAGIVSAKGRILPNESYVPFIQTDVAVNPGNSGGPLFNMRGEVVGINSQIYSGTGGYMGVSFAIPIGIAMDVAQQLRTSGKVARSRIGVQAQELTRGLAASFGLQEPRGALVANVERGGPADKAGLQPGDIVLSLNGQPVQSSADLARLVAGVKPATTVTAEIWRKGRNVPIKITTVELAAPSPAAGAGATSAAKTGLYLSEIPTMQRRSLGIEGGALVQRAEGAALRAGIQAGDLILRLNDVPVQGVSQLESLLKSHHGKSVALLVRRGPDTLFLALQVPSAQ
ncbi:putative periplasmic serine endoprotease DegP-like [Cupriavidus oxalaticus]|uniref:Probable periplasmic serine endoprotease DegP-like n=2 Tax=Cupriavidus oxalaticus TaxID=96344 RepID=A0A375FU44_9BURK|nr:putative periplasmic serine endoprotease DegP-like [Cupriavidus oxalaticus]